MNPDSKPSASSSLWFYSQDGNVIGPFTFEELRALVQNGSLAPDVLAVPDGREDWKPLSEWDIPQGQQMHARGPLEAPRVESRERRQKSASKRANALYGRANDEAAMQREGCKKGCGGCLVLLVVGMLFSFVFETCSKWNLTLSDAERKNPQEAVQKLMSAVYGSKLREVEAHQMIEVDGVNGLLNIYVRVNADMLLTNSHTVWGLDQDMKRAFKALYESGLPVYNVTIWNYAALNDRYGKVSDDVIYEVELHSREASKIEWSNVDAVSFDRVWEVKFLHPALTK